MIESMNPAHYQLFADNVLSSNFLTFYDSENSSASTVINPSIEYSLSEETREGIFRDVVDSLSVFFAESIMVPLTESIRKVVFRPPTERFHNEDDKKIYKIYKQHKNLLFAADHIHELDERTLNNTLIEACEHGNLKFINALIKSNRLENVPINYFLHSLFLAVEEGHVAIMKILVASSRFQSLSDDDLVAAFILAAQKGHFSIIDAIIASNRFLDIPTNKLDGAFLTAIEHGCVKAALAIIASNRFLDISPDALGEGFVMAIEGDYRAIVTAIIISDSLQDIPVNLLEEALSKDLDMVEIVTAEHLGNNFVIAARYGCVALVNVIIALEGFQDVSDYHLRKAILSADDNGHVDIIGAIFSSDRWNSYEG